MIQRDDCLRMIEGWWLKEMMDRGYWEVMVNGWLRSDYYMMWWVKVDSRVVIENWRLDVCRLKMIWGWLRAMWEQKHELENSGSLEVNLHYRVLLKWFIIVLGIRCYYSLTENNQFVNTDRIRLSDISTK